MSYTIKEKYIGNQKEFENAKTIEYGIGKDYYVLKDEKPYVHIKVEDHGMFTEVILFENHLYIGDYTSGIHIVNLLDFTTKNIEVDFYFGSFQISDDFLYALGGCNVIAFDRCSQIIWKSDNIAVDGITFDRIENDTMYVECEMNPPGGWIKEQINLKNGKNMK